MAQTQTRITTIASVQNIMNSRKKITEAMNGQYIVLTVRGNGNTIAVKDKNGDAVKAAGSDLLLEKKIFNTLCNSSVAVKNERNQATLKEALAAEKAGDSAKAGELYNDYLNKTQVSVSVLSGTSNFDRIQDGDQIKGRVQVITTEKGSILTLDPKTISVVAPGYGEDSSFDLLSMATEVPAESTAPAFEKAAA